MCTKWKELYKKITRFTPLIGRLVNGLRLYSFQFERNLKSISLAEIIVRLALERFCILWNFRCLQINFYYTYKTILLFPFKLNRIWSWWQFFFRFEPNGIPFGSKSKGKLSPRSYPIHCERKWNTIFLSVHREVDRESG